MPLLWLRVALVFYGLGLVYTLFWLARRPKGGARGLIPALALGAAFQAVSLVEVSVLRHDLVPTTLAHAESLLAWLMMLVFLGFWARYKAAAPAALVLPLVFLLTLGAEFGSQAPAFSSPLARTSWIFVHVTLIFIGYAGLFLSLAASILYLLQERRLKSKSPVSGRMPALAVIDQIGYRSLLVGFPFMTLGLVAGAVVAQVEFGARFFNDPKILLSILLWLVYLVLLYTRWSAGWRGKRSAYLATAACLAAVVTWAANYFSGTHRFLGP